VLSLSGLVDNLLDVSRLSVGRRPTFDIRSHELAAVVVQVVERHQTTAQRAGSPITIHTQATPIVAADRLRLEQILANLLSNAIKFGAGRPIEITIATEAGRAQVTVQDHGVGIPSADLGRIFDRFDRGSAPVGNGGLGLGLWISRRLAEEMDGTIRVASPPNAVAAFTLELPVHLETTVAPAITGDSPPS
jgi:signal transduction histidine kinase